jgi:hypothetical protein
MAAIGRGRHQGVGRDRKLIEWSLRDPDVSPDHDLNFSA